MAWTNDPIEVALNYWNESDDAWEEYKRKFLTYGKSQRADSLIKVDEYLGGDLKPTHETASLWTKRRELDSLHRQLDRIGR